MFLWWDRVRHDTPSLPPPPLPAPAPVSDGLPCAYWAGVFGLPVVAGALQWRYARNVVGVKPSAVLTGLSSLLAAIVGLSIFAALSRPWDRTQSVAHIRSEAQRDEALQLHPDVQAMHIRIGTLPWPYPLRATANTATIADVPDWVDRHPPDFDVEWSASRMEWKRRMAEERRYTAEDVAVRHKIHHSAEYSWLLARSIGWALYGAAVWAWHRRSPPSSRPLFGALASTGLVLFDRWFGVDSRCRPNCIAGSVTDWCISSILSTGRTGECTLLLTIVLGLSTRWRVSGVTCRQAGERTKKLQLHQ